MEPPGIPGRFTLGWVVGNEKLSEMTGAGTALILLGVWLVSRMGTRGGD